MDGRQLIANVSLEREFTFAENCSADARHHSINVMTRYFLLSLWSFGHISYTVVKTRLQVVESCRTCTNSSGFTKCFSNMVFNNGLPFFTENYIFLPCV